jgi:hypothetical protein
VSETVKYATESNESDTQRHFRELLNQRFRETPLPLEYLVCNFGLYTRSSILVKILVINEIYEMILNVPGVIMEFGVSWGQNLAFFENLRAIYEPFNKTRRVIGFDSFKGYTGFSDRDRRTAVMSEGGYAVFSGYKEYLKELLEIHEGSNVMGHLRGRHELVEGNVMETVPKYFKAHPETIVSLAYLDVGLYGPTKSILEGIKPHLVPGSVILLDELTWDEAPGEAIAFKEVFRDVHYKIKRSRYTAQRAIVTIG